MTAKKGIRLDKWLWAVRIYKTRSMATEACKKGRIMVNNTEAKPSREVLQGDVIIVRKLPVVYTYKVKELLKNRVSASLVEQYAEDLTSVEELNKLKINDTFFVKRDKGSGRPTKKERRLMDRLRGGE